jgi:enamine deaminase RidA (YjgF/YER057c/UK114 family)
MSSFKTYSYPGFGEWAKENFSYAQAVRIGDRIHCSGQGGWDRSKEVDLANIGSIFPANIGDEIDTAFSNADHNLKHAGGKGWSQVYRVVTYSTDIPSQHEHMVRNLRKWMPDHHAVWTELGVKELGGGEAMHFEIDVEAYDPEGASAAAKKP